jgi:uncharacterized membrane protein
MRVKLPGWLHARTFVAALLVGSILHIASTLFSAHLASRRAYAAVADKLPVNQMQVLPPATASMQAMPFQSPDMRYAACRFDASEGPVAVKVALPGLGWSVALHSDQGDNFFLLTGQEGRRTELSLLLVPQGDEFVPLPRDVTAVQNLSQVNLPTREGLVIIRGPLPAVAYRAEVEAELSRATCQLRKR